MVNRKIDGKGRTDGDENYSFGREGSKEEKEGRKGRRRRQKGRAGFWGEKKSKGGVREITILRYVDRGPHWGYILLIVPVRATNKFF